jgi:riboflavin synthase alpha subunit
MFTGIVEELGVIVQLDWHGEGATLGVRGATVTSDAAPGDSISVSGVCLTVVEVRGEIFTADVMKETFDRSCLGSAQVGDLVNLERAATMQTRLGGHVVQGHVDGVGVLLSRESGDRTRRSGRRSTSKSMSWPSTSRSSWPEVNPDDRRCHRPDRAGGQGHRRRQGGHRRRR